MISHHKQWLRKRARNAVSHFIFSKINTCAHPHNRIQEKNCMRKFSNAFGKMIFRSRFQFCTWACSAWVDCVPRSKNKHQSKHICRQLSDINRGMWFREWKSVLNCETLTVLLPERSVENIFEEKFSEYFFLLIKKIYLRHTENDGKVIDSIERWQQDLAICVIQKWNGNSLERLSHFLS